MGSVRAKDYHATRDIAGRTEIGVRLSSEEVAILAETAKRERIEINGATK